MYKSIQDPTLPLNTHGARNRLAFFVFFLVFVLHKTLAIRIDMDETAPRNLDKMKEGGSHEEEAKRHVEPVTADWRVETAVKTRWSSITTNPKLILIALFAS